MGTLALVLHSIIFAQSAIIFKSLNPNIPLHTHTHTYKFSFFFFPSLLDLFFIFFSSKFFFIRLRNMISHPRTMTPPVFFLLSFLSYLIPEGPLEVGHIVWVALIPSFNNTKPHQFNNRIGKKKHKNK